MCMNNLSESNYKEAINKQILSCNIWEDRYQLITRQAVYIHWIEKIDNICSDLIDKLLNWENEVENVRNSTTSRINTIISTNNIDLKEDLKTWMILRLNTLLTEITHKDFMNQTNLPNLWWDYLAHFSQFPVESALYRNSKIFREIQNLAIVEIYWIAWEICKELWFEKNSNMLFARYWEEKYNQNN